jgi:hypothetical protein
MSSNASSWSRRKFLASAGATAAGSALVGFTAAPGAAASPRASAAAAGSPISYVDTSESVYDKLTLMSGGRPFFHNGIQFRYDQLKYDRGWTDAQLERVMAMVAQDGFNVVNIPIWWSMVEPSKDVFTWTDIDLCIDWCAKYGLRLEVLWFGSDSDGTSVGQGARLPSYVANGSYQWVVYQDGSRATAGGSELLDKTDPRLLARETYVLGQLMSHLAGYDTTNRLVGVQVLNEPNVSHVHNYMGPDRSYSSYSNQLWNNGHYTDADQFRRDVLLDYQTQLGAVVKQSGHSVYTRSNLVGDAWPITENEALRARGTNTIDFYGNDPYTTDLDRLYNYGTDPFLAQGKNFPMIMENYVGNLASVPQKFSAIAGGAPLNFYTAVHPFSGSDDTEALYNYDSNHVVTRKAATYVIADLNTALNKISTDLASRKPIDAGGKTLQTYNRKAAASVTSTKPVGNYSFTYATTASGLAVAVQRAATEFALVSTQTGTFTLPAGIGSVTSMQTGFYDADDVWVQQGSKSYTVSGSTVVVKLAKNECVRIIVGDGTGDGGDPGLPSGTYKIKNAATGTYLDSDTNGAVVLAPGSTYDDQDWVVTSTASGSVTIRNARTGRYYLTADATNNAVVWNSGDITDSSLWAPEPVSTGSYRLNNQSSGREYMYAASGQVKWNTGATDSSTVWVFEKK